MSLTSRLQALLDYANNKTENNDPNLGEAIKTLVEGYGQGGSNDTLVIETELLNDIVGSSSQTSISISEIQKQSIYSFVEKYATKPFDFFPVLIKIERIGEEREDIDDYFISTIYSGLIGKNDRGIRTLNSDFTRYMVRKSGKYLESGSGAYILGFSSAGTLNFTGRFYNCPAGIIRLTITKLGDLI